VANTSSFSLQNCCWLLPEAFDASKISGQFGFVFMRQKKHVAMNEKRCTLAWGYPEQKFMACPERSRMGISFTPLTAVYEACMGDYPAKCGSGVRASPCQRKLAGRATRLAAPVTSRHLIIYISFVKSLFPF
jgi:hypothetical protein